MHVSRSGNNPRIGIGTNDPKAVFDFKDVGDTTTGAELLLRSARTTQGALAGDEGGSINFVIDSSSFGAATLKTSGSLAKIKTVVDNVTPEGAHGRLIFEMGKDTTNPNIDALTLGYQIGHSAGFNAVFTSSIELKDFNASQESTFTMRDNTDELKFSVNDGDVFISGALEVTGSATFDGS